MKNSVACIAALLCSVLVVAQAPQALNYQAVARNAVGQIVPSQNIGVRFSILDGTATGTVVYAETHSTTTNNFGLFTLAIGRGTATTGIFSTINWGTGDKFLKVEIAPQGGTNYTIQGTTQFLSVPYSLFAEKTRLLAGNNTISITNGNTITGNYQPANNTVTINGNAISGNYQAANNTVTLNGNAISGNYQAANNTVTINGNAISGNYQAGNNTVTINGNAISGNYQGGNNTILVNGNNITGNYQAGTGISIIGNTIAHNFVAGTGINITGNTISATGGNNLWVADVNGIHNQSGFVGIGTNSSPIYPLYIRQPNLGGHSVAFFESDDLWQTAVAMKSNIAPRQFTFTIGAAANHPIQPGSFGLINDDLVNTPQVYSLVINANTNNVGIGPRFVNEPSIVPRSRLTLFSGDINIEEIGRGIILKSPNGQCWRVTVDNAGNLVRTAIACP